MIRNNLPYNYRGLPVGGYDFKNRFGSQYDAAGNFNLGVEGACSGMTLPFVHLGAGVAHQYLSNNYNPILDGYWWNTLAPAGDSPQGYMEINAGYYYIRCGCLNSF
jgi:hypothetical protein